jgi:LacI family transcriptional regulator
VSVPSSHSSGGNAKRLALLSVTVGFCCLIVKGEGTVAERMTMAELAALAGVDVSTVSRALRGDEYRVSPATLARIQRLAREVGYRPDANAASLRSGRSYVIGMLVADLTDVVMATFFEAIRAAAAGEGYLAIVTSTRGHESRRQAAIEDYLARRVDGVVVADATMKNPVPAGLSESEIPFVMAVRSGGSYPSVIADDALGGRLAAEHLLASGHRAFCVVAGPRHTSTARSRLEGFRQALGLAGVPLRHSAVHHGRFGVEDGYRSMVQLLERGQQPTAVFAVNDYNAIGAAHALEERGAVIGVDVALVGYNAIALGSYLQTPLTSIHVDYQMLGRQTISLLVKLMRGEAASSVVLRPELVLRKSSMARPTPR